MACYFGEIIEPTTRAIFDDSSDDEEISTRPEFRFFWTRGDDCLPSVIDVIFVFHGKLSLAFAEAYILGKNSNLIGEIDIDSNDQQYKSLPSRLYVENNIIYCLISPTCSSSSSFEITELLSPILKRSSKVIVFTNESSYNYKIASLNECPAAFIRELKSSENSNKYSAEKLSTPNVISGIPAGLFSWCQIFKKNSSAFICYSDQEKLDSITSEPYLFVIKNLGYNVISCETPDLTKKSFYGKPEIICASSNMYM